jgi:UDP-glucose 4-epimerase
MVEVTDFEAPITRAERRPGDAREVYFNPAKAKRELRWEAQVPLVDGMRKTYEYFRDRDRAGIAP